MKLKKFVKKFKKKNHTDGFEPGTPHLQSEHSTTELQSQMVNSVIFLVKLNDDNELP